MVDHQIVKNFMKELSSKVAVLQIDSSDKLNEFCQQWANEVSKDPSIVNAQREVDEIVTMYNTDNHKLEKPLDKSELDHEIRYMLSKRKDLLAVADSSFRQCSHKAVDDVLKSRCGLTYDEFNTFQASRQKWIQGKRKVDKEKNQKEIESVDTEPNHEHLLTETLKSSKKRHRSHEEHSFLELSKSDYKKHSKKKKKSLDGDHKKKDSKRHSSKYDKDCDYFRTSSHYSKYLSSRHDRTSGSHSSRSRSPSDRNSDYVRWYRDQHKSHSSSYRSRSGKEKKTKDKSYGSSEYDSLYNVYNKEVMKHSNWEKYVYYNNVQVSNGTSNKVALQNETTQLNGSVCNSNVQYIFPDFAIGEKKKPSTPSKSKPVVLTVNRTNNINADSKKRSISVRDGLNISTEEGEVDRTM